MLVIADFRDTTTAYRVPGSWDGKQHSVSVEKHTERLSAFDGYAVLLPGNNQTPSLAALVAHRRIVVDGIEAPDWSAGANLYINGIGFDFMDSTMNIEFSNYLIYRIFRVSSERESAEVRYWVHAIDELQRGVAIEDSDFFAFVWWKHRLVATVR